jgi:SpoVK/Ycf46/Vps4 family AAA+-type ATPase
MIVALSIDEIDGLAPSRQGPSASGGKIDMISVLLSIIGGNKDTRNLVLFGATNRYESMDEAFLRRMNIKLFVGRPSAEARKE